MSDQLTKVTKAGISTGTSVKTLLQVAAPANTKIKIRGWSVYFQGADSAAAPILVELLRQTTAGTLTSLTPVAWNPSGATPQVTASHTATAEPTAGDVLKTCYVHPQSGWEVLLPPDLALDVPGGGRVGLRVTAGASVSAAAEFLLEE